MNIRRVSIHIREVKMIIIEVSRDIMRISMNVGVFEYIFGYRYAVINFGIYWVYSGNIVETWGNEYSKNLDFMGLFDNVSIDL